MAASSIGPQSRRRPRDSQPPSTELPNTRQRREERKETVATEIREDKGLEAKEQLIEVEQLIKKSEELLKSKSIGIEAPGAGGAGGSEPVVSEIFEKLQEAKIICMKGEEEALEEALEKSRIALGLVNTLIKRRNEEKKGEEKKGEEKKEIIAPPRERQISLHERFVKHEQDIEARGFSGKVRYVGVWNAYIEAYELCRESIEVLINNESPTEEEGGREEEKKKEKEEKEALAIIWDVLGSAITPNNSCGSVSSGIADIFLEENEAKKIKFDSAEIQDGKDEGCNLPPDEKQFLDAIRNKTPCLVMFDISCQNEDKSYTSSHSYCLFVPTPEREKDLTCFVHQAYLGNYGLAHWYKDEKFKPQKIKNYYGDLKEIHQKSRDRRNLRKVKDVYNLLYNLTNREKIEPVSHPIKVCFKVGKINIEKAFNIIEAEGKHINYMESRSHSTGQERVSALFWSKAKKDFREKTEEIKKIKEKIMRKIPIKGQAAQLPPPASRGVSPGIGVGAGTAHASAAAAASADVPSSGSSVSSSSSSSLSLRSYAN